MKQPSVNKIISFYTACRDQIDDEMRDIHAIWRQCENQYLCKKSWGDKKKWQSKTYVPISKPKIKRAVRLIKRILMSTDAFFDFEHPGKDPLKKKQCNITRRALQVHLRSAEFLDQFAEALEAGFVMSMMIIKWWIGEDDGKFSIDTSRSEIVRDRRLKLKCKAINPYNFFFTRDKKIVIEDEWITLPELRKMTEQKTSDGKDLYEMAQVRKLLSGDYGDQQKLDEDEAARLRRLGINKEVNRFRKDVLLSHFWGPLINQDNEITKENCHFIVANGKYLILEPKENPFWHEKAPYIFDSPMSVLFRHVGKGLTEDVRSIEDSIVDFVNLQMDNLLWKQLGIREVDAMAFDDAGRSDLMELYPGKMVKRRTGYQGEAFKYHELGFNPDTAMPMLQELMSFHESDHGVTAYVEQMGGQAGEKATIYAGKKASAMSDFQSIAQDIERGFLVKCIDMARDLMVQYLSGFDTTPNMAEIFAQEGLVLDELGDDERKRMIVTDLDIIGRGISVFFDRMEKIEKIGSMVKMYNALPESAQDYIPWDQVIKEFHDAFAMEKVDLLSDEQVAELQAKRAQAQNQQMMMAIQQFQDQQALEREKIKTDFQKTIVELKHETEENQKDRMLEIGKALMNEPRTYGKDNKGSSKQ